MRKSNVFYKDFFTTILLSFDIFLLPPIKPLASEKIKSLTITNNHLDNIIYKNLTLFYQQNLMRDTFFFKKIYNENNIAVPPHLNKIPSLKRKSFSLFLYKMLNFLMLKGKKEQYSIILTQSILLNFYLFSNEIFSLIKELNNQYLLSEHFILKKFIIDFDNSFYKWQNNQYAYIYINKYKNYEIINKTIFSENNLSSKFIFNQLKSVFFSNFSNFMLIDFQLFFKYFYLENFFKLNDELNTEFFFFFIQKNIYNSYKINFYTQSLSIFFYDEMDFLEYLNWEESLNNSFLYWKTIQRDLTQYNILVYLKYKNSDNKINSKASLKPNFFFLDNLEKFKLQYVWQWFIEEPLSATTEITKQNFQYKSIEILLFNVFKKYFFFYNFFIYNIDKKIKKFLKKGAIKYRIEWKYIPPYKRLLNFLNLFKKNINFFNEISIRKKLSLLIFELITFNPNNFIYKLNLHSYNYIYKNNKYALLRKF